MVDEIFMRKKIIKIKQEFVAKVLKQNAQPL